MQKLLCLVLGALASFGTTLSGAEMPRIQVSPDRRGFVTETGEPFVPWGVNYDHDDSGRLIEDYWTTEWERVAGDFAEMRQLGFNVVRVHLQVGKFMTSATEANREALNQLRQLLELAEHESLYLDLTGLGCYHKQDVPAWYDAQSEVERWATQARFWQAVAATAKESPAVLCYDLMNEPVVPGGKRKDGDWLGPAFAGKHFVQVITLDQSDRPRPEIAKAWIDHLVAAVRKVDQRHLVTVGLVDWSLDRPGLTSGFVPDKVTENLDFVAVHLYPKSGKVEEAISTLRGFAVGKPIIIEETFPLKCSLEEMEDFMQQARQTAAGMVSFYWGKTPAELQAAGTLQDAVLRAWLLKFSEMKWQPRAE